MQLRGRKRSTAAAVAVIGSLLGGAVASAPTALVAAPGTPTGPAKTRPDAGSGSAAVPASAGAPGAPLDPGSDPPRAASEGPAVWPRPQSAAADPGREVPVGTEAVLVAPAGADPYAVALVRSSLRAAGVRTLHERAPGQALPERALVVRLQGPDAEAALRALGAAAAGDLPDGGYRLAVGRSGGRDTVALAGSGPDGLFHAAQTLRQLLAAGAGKVPGMLVRDWPTAPVRGITEGFYGQPWTQEQRLAQLDFMGRTKQNRLLLAPGDDPLRTTGWRAEYPAERQEEFRALAERARANHVVLGWAVSPGQSMCLASADDRAALARKVDAMWELGFRAFQVQFQDVSYSEWGCRADRVRYGTGPAAAAKAHAEVAGELAAHLAARHPGAAPLSLLPTEYFQEGATTYRAALAGALDARVEVAWTGVGVVPRTITGGELAGARSALGHPLVTMDNYPVNDWDPGRIFLGPYAGRDPAVASGSAGMLANAMPQGTLSRVPLFTAADYSWNPRGYRAGESWSAAVRELAGPDPRTRAALAALAGNTASSGLKQEESAYLRPLAEEFWRARSGGDRAAADRAADRLRAAFTVLREAPARLPSLSAEAGPWLERLSRYGAAGELAVDLLRAQARGDGAAAWQASRDLAAARGALAQKGGARVDASVLDPFLAKAAQESDAWTGAARPAGTVRQEAGSWTVRLDSPRPVSAVTVMTDPLSPEVRGAVVEAHVPGEGWRKIGDVAGSGWTQADAGGVRADEVRLSWAGAAPAVHQVVPWFADGPRAAFELAEGGRADVEIGGGPRRVSAELSALLPGEVRGPLSAAPPTGVEVRVPQDVVVPRGTRVSVPVEVTVPAGTPAGTYQVPLAFDGQSRTLTVRAVPRTGGPDLLRTARAVSSGEEGPLFPASAAVDGSAATRWSSPAVDGAWWRAELAAPARVGLVTLHWQEAYPSQYRVETSPDGVNWRPGASVTSRGGVDTVRLEDAPDTRFLRVTCERRATRYGCSLWSASAFAVAP
ncbi:beta-N-acetylglucosaminidase domain-containing protein [Streptomyces sp. NBC_00249]|uniref:beta-N-acetylglucosaminidase domain-containing protein n=1 Tax=Streptomyces sp. NBC_00249 TaxID=2975690 RepID=UPI0022595B93|nr:beta-N-acetylglucosaminidase domain-containing protein [Streptomyces sp. NBC_00249]MCX5198245.1 beta-N-acetylglucosaminidase domain-containing protein [Streptomyces sp. NBC_00249]